MVCLTILWVSAGTPALFKVTKNDGPKTSDAPQAINSTVLMDDDAILGDKNAPVTIVEFSDFQCPFCRTFWSATLSQIKKEYIDTGKVKFIYRDFPLPFHPAAEPSAEATECAADQNKYWEMSDVIFAEQAKRGEGTIQYTVTDIKKWASQIGLDMIKFNSCMDSGKYKSEVEKDAQAGASFGVSGTPTTFINGQMMVDGNGNSIGASPFSVFKKIIDEELAK
ncbi:MAG: DSBA oxidoreductase [Candidatus Yanofskybacteria bacterium GW2011_GWD2_39_48]|uniref:DSBA oxidoreductase n=1 Tax=Candidatus Yanofskybacteria bacterium GW2011_GWD2_39_48 TaxID=1619031 RepID=A0A0G0RIB4_9BACT|nr:MAG: DSBA oxidoreductase [Candidatus Yanofskybacteria bacterium GW2011_GWD2_39_48]